MVLVVAFAHRNVARRERRSGERLPDRGGLRGRRGRPRVGAGANQRSDAARRRLPAERRAGRAFAARSPARHRDAVGRDHAGDLERRRRRRRRCRPPACAAQRAGPAAARPAAPPLLPAPGDARPRPASRSARRRRAPRRRRASSPPAAPARDARGVCGASADAATKPRARLEAAWALLPALRAAPAAALTRARRRRCRRGRARRAQPRRGRAAARRSTPAAAIAAQRAAHRRAGGLAARRRRSHRATPQLAALARRPLLRPLLRHGRAQPGRAQPGGAPARPARGDCAAALGAAIGAGAAPVSSSTATSRSTGPPRSARAERSGRRSSPPARCACRGDDRDPRRRRRRRRSQWNDARRRRALVARRGPRRRRLPRRRRRRLRPRRRRARPPAGRQRQLRPRQRQLEGLLTMALLADPSAATRQRGISLLESLVAFVVLGGEHDRRRPAARPAAPAGDVARERSEAVRLGARGDRRRCARSRVVAAASAPRSYAGHRRRRRRRSPPRPRPATPATRSSAASTTTVRRRRQGDLGQRALERSRRRRSARSCCTRSSLASPRPTVARSASTPARSQRATRGVLGRAPSIPIDARDLGNGRSAWKPSERGTRRWSSTTAAALSSAAATMSPRRPRTRDLAARRAGALRERPLAARLAGTIRFAASAAAAPVADSSPLTIALGAGHYAAAPACFSEAMKTVRYVADGSLHLDAVAADATAGRGGRRALGRHRRALRRLALRRHAARRRPLVGPRHRRRRRRWTIGSGGGGDRRVCSLPRHRRPVRSMRTSRIPASTRTSTAPSSPRIS